MSTEETTYTEEEEKEEINKNKKWQEVLINSAIVSKVSVNIYEELRSLAQDFTDLDEFNKEVTTQLLRFKTMSSTGKPDNSTFRSALSVIRTTLQLEADFTDSSGSWLSKAAQQRLNAKLKGNITVVPKIQTLAVKQPTEVEEEEEESVMLLIKELVISVNTLQQYADKNDLKKNERVYIEVISKKLKSVGEENFNDSN